MLVLPLLITAAMFFALRVVSVDDGRRHSRSNRQGDAIIINVSESYEITQHYTHVANDISMFRSDTGNYFIVLPDNQLDYLPHSDRNINVILITFCLLGAVFWVNLMLTRRISNRIVGSIDTLVKGVNEIASGNLTYRIDYNENDEFDAVCADFNEMAARLLDMVNERQKDERNRRELIAGISHDLRTPLTSIKAYLEGIKKGVAATPEMQEKYLDTIQSKTEDIEYIISQLFLFSKMDIGEFPLNREIVDIGATLCKMIEELADEYKEKCLEISLTKNIQGIFVSIDTVQFRNVLQNILGNSVKYCNRNDARAEITCQKNDDNVSITIKDNGSGVTNEMLIKIFEVFYRGDIARNNPSQGSGLGLAISSKIIERLGGSIQAKNAPEGGLSIIITLPIATNTKGASM